MSYAAEVGKETTENNAIRSGCEDYSVVSVDNVRDRGEAEVFD